MFTRRQLLGGTVLAGLGSHLTRRTVAAELKAAADSKAATSNSKTAADFCSYVDPFIGTGGHGHTFPGATVPFGMVQLSPIPMSRDGTPVRAITTTTRRFSASRTPPERDGRR